MPFGELIAPWLRAFVFTQIVEAPVYRRVLDVSWGRALAPSAITHPFVWFAFPPLARALGFGWLGMAIMAELFAWLVEALFLAKTRPRVAPGKALLVSLVANATSVALGLTCRKLFGVP
ncbi:MAG: hypothetical protein JST00_10695 [Deltaproteobacteria bacterium]|nr:hypothetical protein [Deltaproteobacteria bacterium]